MNKPDWIAAKEDGYLHNAMKCEQIDLCFQCTSQYGKEEAWARYQHKQMQKMGWRWSFELRDWVLPEGTPEEEYNEKKQLYYSLIGCNQHCIEPDCKIENCANYY